MHAVDDVQRPVVLTALARQDHEVGLVLGHRPDGLVDALGHREEREARVVRQRPLDVERVEAFDCDECADWSFHGGYRFVCELMSFCSWSVVIAFLGGSLASPAGRNRNHMTPESDASAIV